MPPCLAGAELCFFYQRKEVASRGYFVPKISELLHWPRAVSQPAASKQDVKHGGKKQKPISAQWWSLMVSSETDDATLLSQAWGKRARMAQLYYPAQMIISTFPGADTWDATLHSKCMPKPYCMQQWDISRSPCSELVGEPIFSLFSYWMIIQDA